MSLNLDLLSGMAGQTVEIKELTDLNKALRAAGQSIQKASAGYPTQGVSATGDFSPLLPQSIQQTLDTASYTEEAIRFWKRLTKVPVDSTLHESAVVTQYGSMALDPFMAEGGGGTRSDGTYERKIVKVKYLHEKREITDVATMVGVIGYSGVSKQGLAQQTLDGTKALLGKQEMALFMADENLSPLHYSGLYAQLTKTTYVSGKHLINGSAAGLGTNYTDFKGAAVTPNDLIEHIYKVFAAPNFGMVNVIYVEPRVYAALVNIATSLGRFDMNRAGQGTLIFGTDGLKIAGPNGLVTIETAPLYWPDRLPNATSQGENPATLVQGDLGLAAAGDADSKFTNAEAGSYFYKFVAVGDEGVSGAVVTAGAQAVAAAQKVTVTIQDAGKAASGAGSTRWYRVYRSDKDGAAGTCEFMWNYPRAAAGQNTVIVDLNQHRTKCAPVYMLEMNPGVMYWAQLLDFLRRPLAQPKTTIPFLLMLFGALHVKIPSKCWVMDNVALTA